MYRTTVHTSIYQNSPDTEQEIRDPSLFVEWSSPTWEKELQDITVQDRQPGVELICICRGLICPTAKWFHKGREVFSDFHMKLRQVENAATLTIKNIREQDNGKFKCIMTGENGELETSCVLSIKDPDRIEPPVFVKELHDVEVEEGEKLELAVDVKGTPHIGVFWYHNNVEITHDSPHFLLASLGQVHTLTLLHATSESSGEYVCEAYNDFGDTDTFCFVEVREVEHPEPPDFVTFPNTQTALEGESVTFSCQVKGQPMPTVLWERDGVVIATSQKYKITKILDQHSLTVYNADQTDAGEYICHLHSPESDTSYICNLHVVCKNKSEHFESADPLKSRSVHVDGIHLTSSTDFKSLQKEEPSSSPEISWKFNSSKFKVMAESVGETTTTKTTDIAPIRTNVAAVGKTTATSVHTYDVQQTDGGYYNNYQNQQRPYSDHQRVNHDMKSDIRQQSGVSVSQVTDMSTAVESASQQNLSEIIQSSNSFQIKNYKKIDEKKNIVNTNVTDFRSVLKHRDRSSPTPVSKSQPPQSSNTDFRNVLSRDKGKQQGGSQFKNDSLKGSTFTYDLTNVSTSQTSAAAAGFSHNVHSTAIHQSTSLISSSNSQNDSQPFKNLGNKRVEANVNDLGLKSAQKNYDFSEHLDSQTHSHVELSMTEKRDWRKSKKIAAQSALSSQSLERTSNNQGIQSSTFGKSSRENVSTHENNSEITIDINYPASMNISDKSVTGKNLDNNTWTQNKPMSGSAASGETLFKSEIQILETKKHREKDRVINLTPDEEINIVASLNTRRCSSNDSPDRSENSLSAKDKLNFESEKLTSKSVFQKEDTRLPHNVSVIHFNPQMASTPPGQEEFKLEVTSVSVSMPLRSSISLLQLQSQKHSGSLSLSDQMSCDDKNIKQDDTDEVFADRHGGIINPDNNSSINDQRQTLQSFGSMFTWEKAPWEETDVQESKWSSPETKMQNVTENIKRNRSSSLLESRINSKLYLDSKDEIPSNFDSGISSQLTNVLDSITDSSSKSFRNVKHNPAFTKGSSELSGSRNLPSSKECVYADIKLKPVSKSNEKSKNSKVSSSAESIKDRGLSDLLSKSKQDIFQKNIKVADSATSQKTAADKLSNNLKTSVNQPKYEKQIQDSKIRSFAEKYEKSSASTLPRTHGYSKSLGIAARYEESIKDAYQSNKNMVHTSPNAAKNNLTTNAAKPQASGDSYSGNVLSQIEQWNTAEISSPGRTAKKMLGAIGKSNSNNAILENENRSYLGKVQNRLEQKRHSLQMNIFPSVSSNDKNILHAEDVTLSSKHNLIKSKPDVEKAKENLQAPDLSKKSEISQKREMFENVNKKNQLTEKSETESRNIKDDSLIGRNMKESEPRNMKADIVFDRNMKESEPRNMKADIVFDRNMKESEPRNMKADIVFDRNMKESESRNTKDNIKDDKNIESTDSRNEKPEILLSREVEESEIRTGKATVSQDKSVNISSVELSVRNKGIISKTIQNDQNAKPEWVNRKPVNNIEAKIKEQKQKKTRQELTAAQPSSNFQKADSGKGTKNKSKSAFDADRNTSKKDTIKSNDDASLQLSETDVLSSRLKQIGPYESDKIKSEGIGLFSGKPQSSELFTDANSSKLYNINTVVVVQNNDTKLQTAAATTGVTPIISTSSNVTVVASAKAVSVTASASATTMETESVIEKTINNTIPQSKDLVTASSSLTNKTTWITSKTPLGQPEVSEILAGSRDHSSKTLSKEFQANNPSHQVSNKLNVQSFPESLAHNQQSQMIIGKQSLGKQKSVRSHETGVLSSHHEALGSSLDDSESVLSTASISSSSSDASNVTIDSGYPRNTLRNFADNDKFGFANKTLHIENNESCTANSHSKKLDEVDNQTLHSFKMKENIVESSGTEKICENEHKSSDEFSKPGNSEVSHFRKNSKFVDQFEEIQQGESMKERINKTQENCSQVFKDGENVSEVKENEDVADLSNDFGTTRKYSKKRRKNLEKQITDPVSSDIDSTLASRTESDGVKSRFSRRFKENEIDTEINKAASDVVLKSMEPSHRWKSMDSTALLKSEEKESEPYGNRKSRLQQKLEYNKATVEDIKPIALRPSELDLKPTWRASRSLMRKNNALPSKETLNTFSGEEVAAITKTAGNSAPTATTEIQPQLCPPSFPMPLQDTVVIFGSKAVLRCRLLGNPKPEVKWLLNQKHIESSRDIEIVNTEEFAQLTVKETFTEHVGDYSCWAKNSLGTVSSHCTLSLDAPNRTESRALEGRRFVPPKVVFISPSTVSLTRGSTLNLTANFLGEPRPTVTWLHGDRELVSDSHVHIVTEGSTSCLTIKSVSQSDAGKMSVCLTSCTGSDQAVVNICIEDVPGAPVGRPHIYDIDSSSISLSWYGPTCNEGNQVTHYIIEAKTQQEQTWDVIVPCCKDLSCHILGLNPCTAYQFRVVAANKHGLSAPSEHSDRVVTSDPFRSPSDYESEAYADVFTPSVDFQTQDDFPFEPREVKVNTKDKFEDVFELDKEVGKGKFGVVFKCKHRKDETIWAAKIVKCREKDKGVIRREIEIMNKLRHPKLLLLWDAYESPRQMVLVMEYVGAGELFERVIGEDFVLTEGDCVHFLRQICEGVNYMHSNNILHLDLKPENILCISEDSNRIKIIDFGLAQFYKEGQSTKVLFGTPEFIAPEVINYEEIGFVTDMWSIGVICYVLLSGLSPFLGDNDPETLANVTSGEFDFDDEAFDEISDEAKHFISQLLVMKKEKRLMTEHCLAHVWLNPKEIGGFRRRRLNTERLKRFMVRRKWLKTGNAVLAVSRLLKSSNLSSLSSVNTNNNVLTSPQSNTNALISSQSNSIPSISSLQRNVEEVERHQNESTAVEKCSAQFSGKNMEINSQGVSGEIKNLEENSTFSGNCEISSITTCEQVLTNLTKDSLSVGASDVFSLENLSASQTNHSTDQNDNQGRNDNLHFLATTCGSDVNHNVNNQPASSMFLEISTKTTNYKGGIINRTETKENSPALVDEAVLQAPVFIKSMMKSTTCVGDVARFDVVVAGDPVPNVTWYFEDEEIHPDSRHTLDCNHNNRAFSLVIRNIEDDDEGDYTCKAVNSQGESICMAELSVLEL